MDLHKGARAVFQSYCWWTKSCTTKDDDYPIIYRVLTCFNHPMVVPDFVHQQYINYPQLPISVVAKVFGKKSQWNSMIQLCSGFAALKGPTTFSTIRNTGFLVLSQSFTLDSRFICQHVVSQIGTPRFNRRSDHPWFIFKKNLVNLQPSDHPKFPAGRHLKGASKNLHRSKLSQLSCYSCTAELFQLHPFGRNFQQDFCSKKLQFKDKLVLGGGLKDFLGEDSHLTNIFRMGLKPPTSCSFTLQ